MRVQVEIDLENLKITWSHSGSTEDETFYKSIRVDTAKKFIKQLKMIDLLNWKICKVDYSDTKEELNR